MSNVDKLREYKKLLDEGTITEAEFDKKKKELLDSSDSSNVTASVQSFANDLNKVPNSTGMVGTKSKLAAGLLGIFLGTFGVHNFYLGFTSKAVLQLVLTIVGIITSFILIGLFLILGVEIWGFVEGILILTSHKGTRWHLDASGNDLVD